MDNVFTFPGSKPPPSDEQLREELERVLAEARKTLEGGRAACILVVGMTQDDEVFGAFGGLMNAITMAGLLEKVKLQLLAS